MVKIVAALVVALGTPFSLSASWTVCVEDSDSLLNTPMQAAFLREFQALIGDRDARLEFGACQAESERIRLAVKGEAPEHWVGILGVARRRRDGIEPSLQVFYGPLVRYLGEPNNASAVGRAVARVVAHEAAHFLDQQPHHCHEGLLRARFDAYELVARNPWPFRRARHCHVVEPEIADAGLRAELRESGRTPGGSQ